jgi:hypothetical protein
MRGPLGRHICNLWTQAAREHTLAYLVGALLAFAVGGLGTVVGLDRDRAFYPTVMVVIASYYVLFAVMGGSTQALLIEAAVANRQPRGAGMVACVLPHVRRGGSWVPGIPPTARLSVVIGHADHNWIGDDLPTHHSRESLCVGPG